MCRAFILTLLLAAALQLCSASSCTQIEADAACNTDVLAVVGKTNTECKPIRHVPVYKPPKDMLRPCARERDDAKAVENLVRNTQFPNDGRCKPSKLHATKVPRNGFGSNLLGVAHALDYAVHTKRAMDASAMSLPGFAGKTCQYTFQCFLEPFSTCSPHKGGGGAAAAGELSSKRRSSSRRRGRGGASSTAKAQPRLHGREAEPAPIGLYIPGNFRSRGDLWWSSQMIAHVWRPNAELVQRASSVLSSAGWPEQAQAIGVHVRRGDACVDKRNNRKCFSWPDYAAHVKELVRDYGFNAVFVATDDAETATAALADADLKQLGVTVAIVNADRSFYGKVTKGERIEHRLAKGQGDTLKLGWDASVDLELLAQCQAFVGTFSSTLGRAAFMLQVARLGYVPPFASLDIAWCSAYHVPRGGKGLSPKVKEAAKVLDSVTGRMINYDC